MMMYIGEAAKSSRAGAATRTTGSVAAKSTAAGI